MKKSEFKAIIKECICELNEAESKKPKVGDKFDVGRKKSGKFPAKPDVGTVVSVNSDGVKVKNKAGNIVGTIRFKYIAWDSQGKHWVDKG